VLDWSGAVVSTRSFLYDEWNLIAEFDGTGALVRSYAWGPADSGALSGLSVGTPVLVKDAEATPGT